MNPNSSSFPDRQNDNLPPHLPQPPDNVDFNLSDSQFDNIDSVNNPSISTIPTDATLDFDAAPKGTEQQVEYKFYQINYYRPYFDVDSSDIVLRASKTLLPFGSNFFDYITPTPDLYGPFWIATTLIFLMAVTGNFSRWFGESLINEVALWNYDFTGLTRGAFFIYTYMILLPVLVWVLTKSWLQIDLSCTDHLCTYGYALFVFIPATFVMLVPGTKSLEWLRWMVFMGAGVYSTLFLVMSYGRLFKNTLKKGSIVLIFIIAAQLCLAIALKLSFFTTPTFVNSTAV